MNKIAAWFLIPRGDYCSGCPFHFIDHGKEEQDNGYCSYLGQGDWESEGITLLWDDVKECGVKTK